MKITSSLGEATPLSIYVMPLIFENKVLGAIEVSAFHKISDLQMQLIEQISVDLAIGINNIIKQIESDVLLKRSESLAEELTTQQE